MGTRARRWFCGSALLAGFGLLVGPWPVERALLEDMRAYRAALEAVDRASAAASPTSDLEVGFASLEMKFPEGIPLAGYAARDGVASLGSRDRIRAKAVVLRAGQRTVAIVGADILLVDAALAKRVRAAAARWIRGSDIYFTATHTHSGPGGWAGHWSIGQVTGPSVALVSAQLVGGMVSAIRDAHASLQPARVAYARVRVPELVRNRLRQDPDAPVNPWLQLVRFGTPEGRHIGAFISFSAHATVLGPGNLYLSAGYPGVLERVLERAWGGSAFFFAGSVGSMRPRVETVGTFSDVDEMGAALAEHATRLVRDGAMNHIDTPFRFDFRQIRIPVPSLHVRISSGLRLSPVLAGWLLNLEPQPPVQMLRLGPLLFVGLPAELSGEIAAGLIRYAEDRGAHLVLTSFNGSYVGYVVPDDAYALEAYETGWVNVLGPHGGSFIESVVRRVIDTRFAREQRVFGSSRKTVP